MSWPPAATLRRTLAALGPCLDVTVSAIITPSGTSTDVALLALCRQARKLLAADRYRLLRDWTLPSENRRSVPRRGGIR